MIKKTTPLTLPEKEYALSGNRACSGCGLSIAYRHGLKALGENVMLTVPASCLTVLQGMYPVSSMTVPCLNTAFETTAASATGLRAGLDALGRHDITVVGWAGDGGTADIGIQALSGAAERNTDFIYVCYDNEGYMNTGTQRSGSTPLGASTTTSPQGKTEQKKDMAKIMAAHGIPYIATACPSYSLELFDRFRTAVEIKGTRYIHILVPCPPGWGFEPQFTVKIGRLAVECGIFDLYEIIDGKLSFYGPSLKIAEGKPLRPVEEYLSLQARFRNITPETVAHYKELIGRKWESYKWMGYC